MHMPSAILSLKRSASFYLANDGGAGPSSFNTAAISYSLVHPAGFTMENPPFTISNRSSFVGFPSLLEGSVVNKSSNGSKGGGHNLNRSKLVSNKALSHGARLTSKTEEYTAGDEAICNGAGLSIENEGGPNQMPMRLKFYKPINNGNRKYVSPKWRLQMKDIWGNCGLIEVLANEKGFYFFKFSDDDSCSKVLEAGPWLFVGRMIILKKWHSRLVLTKESYSKVPVWVKFFNIPHEYWTEDGLSYVASAVGKPLYADSLTKTMKIISYARICVEIDATSKLIDSFDLLMGEGDENNNGEILVEYQWKQKICPECKSFGHNAATCPSLKHVAGRSEESHGSKMKQEWVKVNRGAAPVSIPSRDLNFAQVSSVGTKVEEASNNGRGQPPPLKSTIHHSIPINCISLNYPSHFDSSRDFHLHKLKIPSPNMCLPPLSYPDHPDPS
ncbi:hypothetical protein Dsin_001777 [Dipteronia sinensis]|uniref:DUF4283 domain-containing protein n=1 Tax=Dipteronia sinensis TaxID=43782 RepID=A0AAE0EIS7_9ROSI|nr:hypothetical protein Dsin_001777 [Dipteronia sinensis]